MIRGKRKLDHPGELIQRKYLDVLNISVSDLASIVGV